MVTVDNYGDFSITKSRNRKVHVQPLEIIMLWRLTFLISHKTQNFDNGHRNSKIGYSEKKKSMGFALTGIRN